MCQVLDSVSKTTARNDSNGHNNSSSVSFQRTHSGLSLWHFIVCVCVFVSTKSPKPPLGRYLEPFFALPSKTHEPDFAQQIHQDRQAPSMLPAGSAFGSEPGPFRLTSLVHFLPLVLSGPPTVQAHAPPLHSGVMGTVLHAEATLLRTGNNRILAPSEAEASSLISGKLHSSPML